MASTGIRFGTDGWRAVVGDTFTFDNVGRVALATARWLAATGAPRRVVVGYDTRFQGHAFALHAARVIASQGIEVILSDRFVPTPAVSWATRELGCGAGVVLTASHNPAEWNGFKIKADFGGPATPDQVAAVEALVPGPEELPGSLPSADDSPLIRVHDFGSDYLRLVASRVDLGAIRSAGLRIAHDAMYGAGQGAFAALLGADRVVALRSEINPGFGGCPPEPIERNLVGLPEAVLACACDAGIANDGDADRIGMTDERGRFVDSHRLLALLLRYLHEDRGLTGDVVKTFSTTDMLDRMAAEYGLALHTTPIGFKYVCEHFLAGDVLVGGEESGGIAVKGHMPERDGIYIGLLVLEMMARSRRPLSALVEDLFERFGRLAYWRVDARTTQERKEAALARLERDGGLASVAGCPVRSVQTLDGFKHRTDEGWVLVRPSGTEPVLRVYAEAPDEATARRYVESTVAELGL